MKILATLIGSVLVAGAICAQPITNGVALAYFAPENQLFYRMRFANGGYREFERSLDDLSKMTGTQGWRARVSDGNHITVSGIGAEGRETYVFEKGRLISCACPGETNVFDYATPRLAAEDDVPPYHYGSQIEKALTPKKARRRPMGVKELLKGKWNKSGRLQWPFDNPNENGFLYASFALLALYLTLFRKKWLVALGGVLFVGFMVPLVTTASRGSFLAFAVGLLPIVAVRFRELVRARWAWIVFAVVLAFASVWFATHSRGLLTRGFRGKSSWSNEVRLEMWHRAPQMMADAPNGWRSNPGRAYLDWYEDLCSFSAAGSLINDHLSRMVCLGWFGRALYVFGWGAGLLGLLLWGARTKNMVPAGIGMAYGVACWFNPLMINRWLLAAPALSLVPVLASRPWREWRLWTIAAGGGVFSAVAALTFVWWTARSMPHPYGVVVRTDGPRVMVKDAAPEVWIVDDGLSLGGAFVCKDIREWFARSPQSTGVGFVRRCANLPQRRFRRLVLGGEAGDAWLQLLSTDAQARTRLPAEVVFVSPPFPPSAIPPALLANARVKYATGEFCARYSREFDEPPPFVDVVPGMELYLRDWMRYTQ